MVRGVRDINLITSNVLELPIWLNDCISIVTSIILLGSGFGEHLGVRAIGETLKRNQPTSEQQKSPPPCPIDEKYGIHMYRGRKIAHNERVEAIVFDGEFWIMSDMWHLEVGPMSEFREPKIKVCKGDIKVFLQNILMGPPTYIKQPTQFLFIVLLCFW